MRVVSVLPSASEIVFAVGAGASLVGRSEECDFPAPVRDLPVVMRARTLDRDAPSDAIDRRVADSLQRRESLYTLDVPLLARLAPDLLLTQDLCRVCSVTDEEAVAACELAGIRPTVLSLAPRSLDEVWASVETVGAAVEADGAAHRLAHALRERSRSSPSLDARVAVLEWLDPPIESGLWTPEMVRAAGGRSWSITPGRHAERTSWETLERDPPDLVILTPCSFDVDRTVRELSGTPLGDRLARWSVPRGVWVADESYFSRPGPRLADGIELLRSLLSLGRPPAGARARRWPAPGPEAS